MYRNKQARSTINVVHHLCNSRMLHESTTYTKRCILYLFTILHECKCTYAHVCLCVQACMFKLQVAYTEFCAFTKAKILVHYKALLIT